MAALQQRLRQGMLALLAFSLTPDYTLAARYLNHQQLRLFKQMRRSEQLHSLNVLRAVLAQQETTPHELAVAALLHDVGKSLYPLALWQKIMVVLTRAGLPGVYHRLSERGQLTQPLERPFVVYRQHPAWSAEMLVSTGVSEVTLWLVAHHQEQGAQWADHPYATLLQRLQQADDSN